MGNQVLPEVGLIGGYGGFFGGVHLDAVRLAGLYVGSGVLSSDHERALAAATEWGIPRGYDSLDKFIAGEFGSILYATIATPNNLHVSQATALLQAGIPVFCEKPAGRNLAETKQLACVVLETGVPLGFAYTYSYSWGMGLVERIIAAGLIGKIRKGEIGYRQGWLHYLREAFPGHGGCRQAVARTNREISGDSCCGGDVALSHGVVAALYCTEAKIKTVYAHMPALVEGRQLDDNCDVVATAIGGRMAPNAQFVFAGTQTGIGERNNHTIAFYGDQGTVKWSVEDGDRVILHLLDQPERVIHRGESVSADVALTAIADRVNERSTRPGGHPMGFDNWLACGHRQFAEAVKGWLASGKREVPYGNFATIGGALESAAVIQAALESHRTDKPVNVQQFE